MAQTARVARTDETSSGSPIVDIAEALSAPVATNATEVRVETQEKGNVEIKGDYVISKSLIGVLEKFAKKHKTQIEIVCVKSGDIGRKKVVVIKDKLVIYNPVELDGYSNKYSMKLNDFIPGVAESGVSSTQTGVECNFLPDECAQTILSNTPFVPLYSNDSGNLHVAFAIKNAIALHSDFLTDKSTLNDFLKKSLLLSMLKWYEQHDKAEILESRQLYDRNILDNYIAFIRNIQENSKGVLRNQMRGFSEEISGHYRAIQNLEKKMIDASALSTSMARRIAKNRHDTNAECIGKMMEPLLTQDKYTTFETTSDGQSVTGYTHMIEIKHKGKTYKIGEFRVTIKLDGIVMMENLTNCYVDSGDGRYDHPHVHDKLPCLGNIKEQVANMIKDFSFLPLFELLHIYLCTYVNEVNARPFITIARWSGLTPEQWCETCDSPRTDCRGHEERCPSCEEEMSNCDCTRCPANGRLMDNVDCSECDNCDENGECQY